MSSHSAPLRVGVTVDSLLQPRWIARVVAQIVASPACTLAFLAVASARVVPPVALASRLLRDPSHAAHTLFRALDDRVYARPGDALDGCDLGAIAGDVAYASAEGEAVDVVLRLGRAAPAVSARYGVWSLHVGGRASYDDAAGLYEVLGASGPTVTELRASRWGDGPGRVVARAVTRTDVRSVRRSRNVVLAKAPALVLRALRDLFDGAVTDTVEAPSLPRPSMALEATRPGNGAMARMLVEHGLRYAQERVDRAFNRSQWSIAWQRADALVSAEPFHYLAPPKHLIWADPFPLVVAGRRYIFFEEAGYPGGKGHISVLELGDDGVAGAVTRVLEEPYHLSYPFLFRHEGELYMMPEGSERGGVGVYRARSFPYEWERVTVMLPELHIADATLRQVGDRWWLFADVSVDGTLAHSEEFHLFYASSPFGPWTPHRRNPIASDAGRARAAGALFEHDGRLYRPAQDSAARYGYAVSFNEVVRLDTEEYCEVDRGHMVPSWEPRALATHTFNRDGDLTVIDAIVRRAE